ncbi:hypothetical protein AB0M29_19090 [Streptomyces sp. NPDC051976]|uniref:hypothetical protein n=1 Tax=Streptomyces sp. NPDC051976 TaxID=3154947 RepID=UPI00341E3003
MTHVDGIPVPEKPLVGRQPSAAPSPHVGSTGPTSEATRLLCVGTYLDVEYRSRVIEELVEHEERTVAPSLGIDVVPVLAHALRARVQEMQLAAVLLALWAAFLTLSILHVGPGKSGPIQLTGVASPPWAVVYAVICLLIWLGRVVSGRNTAVSVVDDHSMSATPTGRRLSTGRYLRRVAWAAAIFYWVEAVRGSALLAVAFPLAIAAAIGWHRYRVAEVLRGVLAPENFTEAGRPTLPPAQRYQRIRAAVDREQYSPMVIYDPFRPFIGAGEAHGSWSLAIELRRKDPVRDGKEPELTSRDVLGLITPRLERLKEVSAATSRDRLKDLELQECVLLPPGPARTTDLYRPDAVAAHVAAAVDEGAEARRLFLRIRVGAWDEQVIVTILLRVHTQGGMLVLEVIPHVLGPVRAEFGRGDAIAARAEGGLARGALSALLTAPVASVATAVSVGRTVSSYFRLLMTDPRDLPPDGPAASVRELGTRTAVLLFQEMDISRYVKTIQDRIVNGAREALKSQGYETGEFEQQVYNVAQGAVFIGGSMSGGAVATAGGSAAHTTAGE